MKTIDTFNVVETEGTVETACRDTKGDEAGHDPDSVQAKTSIPGTTAPKRKQGTKAKTKVRSKARKKAETGAFGVVYALAHCGTHATIYNVIVPLFRFPVNEIETRCAIITALEFAGCPSDANITVELTTFYTYKEARDQYRRNMDMSERLGAAPVSGHLN